MAGSISKDDSKLSDQQRRFVDEYLIDLNGTQAAIRAGYAANSAVVQASRLLMKANVQSLIAEKQKEYLNRNEISIDRVRLEIARLAFNDPRKAFKENGDIKNIHEWPDEVAAAISSIKVTEINRAEDGTETYLKEIKFWDKGKQLDLAARHLGMLNDKLEVKGNVTIIASKLDERI